MEDYQVQDLEEHYRGKVFFTLLDILSQELHRRFKEKDDTPTGSILSGLHCLISSHWKGMTNDRDALSIRDVCQFYVEEEHVTKLKVFHSSYALPSSNIKAVLRCLKDNDVDMIWFSLIRLCSSKHATIPLTTASAE
ncbi:hypothetical protein N1851_029137 [Merluccius polli]|uniref:Uncharacterized protein n=1 Tax=Merluccius polli TaxID=89951 RepID=A0AA47NRY4_MERPO|nr:hypothetical protein N1851_029137 [Merluccius polli]